MHRAFLGLTTVLVILIASSVGAYAYISKPPGTVYETVTSTVNVYRTQFVTTNETVTKTITVDTLFSQSLPPSSGNIANFTVYVADVSQMTATKSFDYNYNITVYAYYYAVGSSGEFYKELTPQIVTNTSLVINGYFVTSAEGPLNITTAQHAYYYIYANTNQLPTTLELLFLSFSSPQELSLAVPAAPYSTPVK